MISNGHMDKHSINSDKVQAVVNEWINHRFLGEPDGFTTLRPEFVRGHLERCLRVLDFLPNPSERGRLLELGAGYYLMTFLLRRFRNYDLDLAQFWNIPGREYESILVDSQTSKRIVLPFKHFNAEMEPFPYPDGRFDVLLNCEMIEHLLCNPVQMLVECHRVLKPGGLLILTTPNVLRLSNLVGLVLGRNIYDKYWPATPYGRHPREYSPDEIRRLFEEVGFRVIHLETRDVMPHKCGRREKLIEWSCRGLAFLSGKLKGKEGNNTLGMRAGHILMVAEKDGMARRVFPDFLFDLPGLAESVIDAICRPCEPEEANNADGRS
jgi:SAM-dependent methyltransferase